MRHSRSRWSMNSSPSASLCWAGRRSRKAAFCSSILIEKPPPLILTPREEFAPRYWPTSPKRERRDTICLARVSGFQKKMRNPCPQSARSRSTCIGGLRRRFQQGTLSMSKQLWLPSRRLFLGGGLALGLGAPPLSTARSAFAEQLSKTPRLTEGPFYPPKLPLDTDNDLLIINNNITQAAGNVTHLTVLV